jgi:hypothetical protein
VKNGGKIVTLAWVCLPFALAWLALQHSYSHGNANQTIGYSPYQKIWVLAEALASPPVLGVTLCLCLVALTSLSCSTVPLPVTFQPYHLDLTPIYPNSHYHQVTDSDYRNVTFDIISTD